ncbi:DNA-directed RNA polymerase [Candidatus Bathyarchaeota archaeon]|nr:DNA-directed RNA polymerase [Candidatus Bathyarchaeota archaeon]
MFRLVTAEDTVRIPPERFGEDIEKVCYDQLKMKYEGMVDPEIGFVITVTEVKVTPIGRIIPGDGGTYHRVTFNLLTFKPEIQEVVEGEVVEIADFGAFVRIGPVDALLHVSQLMDDFITYDEKQGILVGKETGKRLTIGDRVRVRITAVSIGRGGMASKIGVTARQPFLGKLEWIEEEVKKSRGEEKTEKS